MKIYLPLDNFSFFKVVTGSFFLLAGLLFPLATYFSLIAAVFSRPHGLGAYFSMWRAGKLNWVFASWIIVISLTISFWGIKLASFTVLSLVTYLLFSFHFLYDEFVLQQEERILSNLFSALAPFGLITLYLLSEFFNLHTAFGTFLLIGATALVLEALYVREVNWFIIQTKLLSIFILSSIYLRISPYSVVNVFIISHYFFWFIYPVYKLHKYKPSERDGLIIVLLILAVSSLYSSTTSVTAVNQLGSLDIFTRLFFTGTIIHIFTTAPFAYFMGMPKSVPLPSAIRAS